MVKALHRAGIEVILDVVFNHTGEGNHERPDDQLPGPRQQRLLPCSSRTTGSLHELHRLRQHLQRQSSRCREVHRRLPALLGRARCTSTGSGSTSARSCRAAPDGNPIDDPPVLWHIELDDALADTKMIAEAWDAGGPVPGRPLPGLPLGGVERPLPRRHPAVRARATRASSATVAARIGGSADIYQARRRAADQQHQLHHRARRLHAQRPRLVQRQAQRGQRRGQPRRDRRQPELELRRRGRHDDPGDRARCAPARSATS